MTTISPAQIRVADEVWLAAALLHRENPRQKDFSIEQIVERVDKERIAGKLRPGVYVHVVQHCVANRPPNPGRYRTLFETAPGRRRLFRRGDPYHPGRADSKITPNVEDIPEGYGELLVWYRNWSDALAAYETENDPLLALSGSGRDLWRGEDPDEYVRRLREGWE